MVFVRPSWVELCLSLYQVGCWDDGFPGDFLELSEVELTGRWWKVWPVALPRRYFHFPSSLTLVSGEPRLFNSAFRLNTCETRICQVAFLKKAEVSSTIKTSRFFIQRLTPVPACISLSADPNFSSPLRATAETWYKCKAKCIWDWSGLHFFGQSHSCCLPFTGSQNHSGALPKSYCLDKSVHVRVCVCVGV